MGNSQKRVYGKRGTASSRAVLSDQFLDENEIDKQMLKKGPGQAVSRSSSSSSSLSPLSPLSPFSDPLLSEDDAKPVPPAPVAPVVHKGKRIQSVLVSVPSALGLTLLYMSNSYHDTDYWWTGC